MTEDRVDWYLWNWAIFAFRHKGTANGNGYPRRAMGLKCSDSSKTFEEMCAQVDKRCARAMDSIVDALPANQRHAVLNVHMATVFRIRDQQGSYDEAKLEIGRALKRKGFE